MIVFLLFTLQWLKQASDHRSCKYSKRPLFRVTICGPQVRLQAEARAALSPVFYKKSVTLSMNKFIKLAYKSLTIQQKVRIWNVHFLHVAFLIQLPLLENGADMTTDARSVALEQFSHLSFGKPLNVSNQIIKSPSVVRMYYESTSACWALTLVVYAQFFTLPMGIFKPFFTLF